MERPSCIYFYNTPYANNHYENKKRIDKKD